MCSPLNGIESSVQRLIPVLIGEDLMVGGGVEAGPTLVRTSTFFSEPTTASDLGARDINQNINFIKVSLSWKMDTVQDRLLLPCSFCRNYTTATTTMSSTPTPTTTTTTPCESYQPSTTCQSCVRLYEGLTPHPSTSCAMENVGKTQNNPSPLSTFHSTGASTSLLSSWSHSLRRRWLRHWRVWLDILEPASSQPQQQPQPSTSSQQSFSLLSTSRFPYLVVLVLLCFASSAGACSSRSTPKPRPPSQGTMRPNITFQTYACPPAYAAWYCLNGATCFTVKVADSILYSCECADGYMGQRCEFKDLDGSYLPARERLMMGQNANIGQAFLVVLLIVMAAIIASVIFTLKRTRSKKTRRRGTMTQEIGFDDGLDFVYGGSCGGSTSVLPHYNNNNPLTNTTIGLTTFGQQQQQQQQLQHGTTLGQTTFCETTIGGATKIGSTIAKADTSVLGQSISYTLSRQTVDYSPENYYINGSRSLSRHSGHRIPQVCFRANEHFT